MVIFVKSNCVLSALPIPATPIFPPKLQRSFAEIVSNLRAVGIRRVLGNDENAHRRIVSAPRTVQLRLPGRPPASSTVHSYARARSSRAATQHHNLHPFSHSRSNSERLCVSDRGRHQSKRLHAQIRSAEATRLTNLHEKPAFGERHKCSPPVILDRALDASEAPAGSNGPQGATGGTAASRQTCAWAHTECTYPNRSFAFGSGIIANTLVDIIEQGGLLHRSHHAEQRLMLRLGRRQLRSHQSGISRDQSILLHLQLSLLRLRVRAGRLHPA